MEPGLGEERQQIALEEGERHGEQRLRLKAGVLLGRACKFIQLLRRIEIELY